MSAIRCFKFSFALAIGVALMAPAGAGFFGPSTPQEKLSEAMQLAAGPGRIAKARQYLEEARAECEKTNSKACLAEVNRVDGLFERAGATREVVLMFGGIYGKNPSSENIDRSRPYFDKAIELATEAQDFGIVANVNYELTVSEMVRGTPLAGCVYADRVLVAVKQGQQLHPGERVSMPRQFATPEEWVAGMKKQLGCPAN
jgi:hypothetical protein